jgi:hypothetical protein
MRPYRIDSFVEHSSACDFCSRDLEVPETLEMFNFFFGSAPRSLQFGLPVKVQSIFSLIRTSAL